MTLLCDFPSFCPLATMLSMPLCQMLFLSSLFTIASQSAIWFCGMGKTIRRSSSPSLSIATLHLSETVRMNAHCLTTRCYI